MTVIPPRQAIIFIVTCLLLKAAVTGYPEPINFDRKPFEEIKAKAELGDVASQCDLGWMYANGLGVEKLPIEGFIWTQKAAEQGNARAQCNLGIMFETGLGVERNDKNAFNWYSKSARQGDPLGQYNLGNMYANGKAESQDYREALNWYRKAAIQEVAPAQYNLGIIYVNGTGATQDFVEAIHWLGKAAEQGYSDAQCELGSMYLTGRGVKTNFSLASQWYRKAAEQNNAKAQYNLGRLYANGQGVSRDSTEAIKWYKRASDQGFADAQHNLGILYSAEKKELQEQSPIVNGNAVRRKLTQQELEEAHNAGYETNGFGDKELDVPTPQYLMELEEEKSQQVSPTPLDLRHALIYVDSFMGSQDAVLGGDVITMGPHTLKYRVAGKDIEYSGNYTVLLSTSRKHTEPYLGYGSFETAKFVSLDRPPIVLPNPTIIERKTGFIVVVVGGREWICSGPYSINK